MQPTKHKRLFRYDVGVFILSDNERQCKLIKEGKALLHSDDESKYEEAIRRFNEATKLAPESLEAWYYLGDAYYFYLGESSRARYCFDMVTDIKINDTKNVEDRKKIADKLHMQGGAFYHLGQYDKAIERLNQAIDIHHDYAWSWYGKGYTLYELGRYDKAIECFVKAIEFNTDPHQDDYPHLKASALEGKAWVYANDEKTKEEPSYIEKASKFIEEALYIERSLEEAKQDRALIQSLLDTKGLILYNSKEHDKALEIFKESLSMKPRGNKKYSYYHEGNIQIEDDKNYNEAIKSYDRAIKIDENFAEAHDAKAVGLFYKKEYDNAIDEVKDAIKIKPSLVSAHVHLAKIVSSKEHPGQSFWDFWNESKRKIIVAIILSICAVGIVIYYPLYFGNEVIETKKADINGTTTTTVTTKSAKIPETNLIVLGLIILILLSPEIRKAKMGPIELELSKQPLPFK